MKKDQTERTQLGDRVPNSFLEALSGLAETMGVSRQILTEDAIALWMGKKDPIADMRRQMALSALKTGRVAKPFNWELADSNVAIV